jgi:hypothetical protein
MKRRQLWSVRVSSVKHENDWSDFNVIAKNAFDAINTAMVEAVRQGMESPVQIDSILRKGSVV